MTIQDIIKVSEEMIEEISTYDLMYWDKHNSIVAWRDELILAIQE